jgi:ferredoxin--NADP+ reductase
MSVQQASRSKVAVMPVELEKAKEPPLHLYKPKEPYTATIVSVERLVGPRAPGETCHVVIDHGGNVPYWEGQSYGVIPPVSISCLVLPSVMIMNLYFFVLSSHYTTTPN